MRQRRQKLLSSLYNCWVVPSKRNSVIHQLRFATKLFLLCDYFFSGSHSRINYQQLTMEQSFTYYNFFRNLSPRMLNCKSIISSSLLHTQKEPATVETIIHANFDWFETLVLRRNCFIGFFFVTYCCLIDFEAGAVGIDLMRRELLWGDN